MPAYLKDLEIPSVGTSRRLQYYNKVLKQISQSADGLVSPLQLHDYIVSQREVRWSVKEDIDQLEHEKESLLDPTSGYGQNIAKYSGRNDLLTAADVHKCANTIKALNLLNVKLQKMKDELLDQRKNLFDKTTLKIKEWKANELSFYDSALKSVIDGINEIDSKNALLSTTLIFLNGRFPAIVAQQSEDRRIKKRRKDNKNKKIRHAKARLNEGRKKLIKLLLDGEIAQH